MMLEWMVRAVIVGGIATCAAWLFERAFRNVHAGTRHAWSFAVIATIVLPLIPRLTDPSAVSAVVPAITLPTVVLTGGAEPSTVWNVSALLWIVLSSLVALAYAIAFVRLQRARRTWRRARLLDDEVFLSDRFGPAIFGFIAPRIVVPEWVQSTSPDEQRLIMLHEREHIRAKDQWQLLLTMLATTAMPWNPFVWIQTRRLRFALEADCDQRVLAAIPDHERYATLLVDVGSRQMGLWLTPALAEHRNGLERRIKMLANTVIRNRWKAAAMMVLGVGATVVACESRLPQEPKPMRDEVRATTTDRTVSDGVSEVIADNYPPLLRDAGIGGTVRLTAKGIVNGKLVDPQLVGTSGHDALDVAGLRAAKMLQYPVDLKAGQLDLVLEFDPNRKIRSLTALATDGQDKRSLPRKMSSEPSFTRFTQKPDLANRDDVMQALKANYPPVLRNAGVGGSALVWILIDESGRVVDTKIKTTSGHEPLDQAAERIAEAMQFTPALDGTQPVPVWIALPIEFRPF